MLRNITHLQLHYLNTWYKVCVLIDNHNIDLSEL